MGFMSEVSMELFSEKDMFNFSKVLYLETLKLCVLVSLFSSITGLKLTFVTFPGIFYAFVGFLRHSRLSSKKSSVTFLFGLRISLIVEIGTCFNFLP
jgi:hypothetical protein